MRESGDLELAKERGSIIEKLDSLSRWIESIDKGIEDHKKGQGERIERHGERLTSLEVSVKILLAVAWLVFASSLTIAIQAIWKSVYKS